MPGLTVDANVWVSAFDSSDRFHEASVAFLWHLANHEVVAHAPAILKLEIACALARRYAKESVGRQAADRLDANRLLVLEPLSEALLAEALRLGTRARLRAADALYAATAALQTKSHLVSWNQELIDRAGAVTPTDWLASQR